MLVGPFGQSGEPLDYWNIGLYGVRQCKSRKPLLLKNLSQLELMANWMHHGVLKNGLDTPNQPPFRRAHWLTVSLGRNLA